LGSPTDRRIRVIEQQGLGPHRSLSLIEIDRQAYVALIAPGAATLVALERPAPAAGASPA
jgi:flagellar biogenesis protein FliO